LDFLFQLVENDLGRPNTKAKIRDKNMAKLAMKKPIARVVVVANKRANRLLTDDRLLGSMNSSKEASKLESGSNSVARPIRPASRKGGTRNL
jgi:hypothetical protein